MTHDFYDGDGNPVSVDLPQIDREQTSFEIITEVLDDTAGLSIEKQATELDFAFQELLERQTASAVRDGVTQALRQIFLALDGSTAAIALRNVLLGRECPVRLDAEKLGCSHVALLKQEAKLTKRLQGVTKPDIGI